MGGDKLAPNMRAALQKKISGCPYLFLAPMEGVGDRNFRQAMAAVGGFDEAVTDFLRVPRQANVKALAKAYQACETYPIPLAAQIMGSDTELMALMAIELEKKSAPRIDINCGCPSNTVTGRAAGSSLLKNPKHLFELARSVVGAVKIPVTIKMRSGFQDTSLFKENILAAQESGVAFITLHPRTKVEGYRPPAHWHLISEAKAILKIPVVGNGDILNVHDALRMLKETSCDALMIGRASVMNPFIFHQIRSHFTKNEYSPTWAAMKNFILDYFSKLSQSPERHKINKMKQLMGFIFKNNDALLEIRKQMLASQESNAEDFVDFALLLLKERWAPQNN